MTVNFSIKQVPEDVAERLRQRARVNRRSLQAELMLIVERAADEHHAANVGEPTHAPYHARPIVTAAPARKSRPVKSATMQSASGKLGLDALWRRARKLGAAMPAESTAIVRRDRDARQRR